MKYPSPRSAEQRGADGCKQRSAPWALAMLFALFCSACRGAVLEPQRSSAEDPNSEADAGGPVARADAGSSPRRDAGAGSTSGVRDAGGPVGTSDAAVGPVLTGELDHELLGAYCGNSTADLMQFETWLGRPVDAIHATTGAASWQDFDTSVGWSVGLWKALDRRVLWSVPIIVTGSTLADAAAGKFDDHYRKAAQTLSTFRPQDGVLYVRTGWEFNGAWFNWTAKGGKAQDFIGAYRHFVAAFRSVSNRFRFEWNISVGDEGMNPEDAYPGDDVVDIIGVDFYWKSFDPTDPTAAWNKMVTQKYGLQWQQTFAAAHGKRAANSEWGIMFDNAGPYVQSAQAWFKAHDVVYQSYWNSDLAYKGKLSSGQYAATGSAYKAMFGP